MKRLPIPVPRQSHQRGQALSEFLVLAVALLPLFLLLPMIGRYQDIAHAVQLASRYVAFDATSQVGGSNSWKPASQLAEEVRLRFFSDGAQAIVSGVPADDAVPGQNPLWQDPQGHPLLANPQADTSITFGAGHAARQVDGFGPANEGAAFAGVNKFGLPARGIYSANVGVTLANLPPGLRFYEPFDRISLSMERSTALLLDGWTARDPQAVEGKIAGNAAVFPAAELASLGSAVDPEVRIIDALGGIAGPRLGRLDFWRDVVPEDRLKPGGPGR